MKIRLTLLLLSSIFFATGCQTTSSSTTSAVSSPPADAEQSTVALIEQGEFGRALSEFLYPTIAEYEAMEAEGTTHYRCARTPEETLYYLVMAAAVAETGESDGRDTVVLDYFYAASYYYVGYILIESGRISEAKNYLEKAVELSPKNTVFLNELGHIAHVEKDWEGALEIFSQAAAAAAFSPDETRDGEEGRALRGKGYALIEMERFDEAVSIYERCLEINPKDVQAQQELEYIESLRKASKD
jgi:tetratricopeptide (TPR) repeat protein